MVCMKFKVVLKEDLDDCGYNISCPALPGCHSQGDSVEEALENIKEAITGILEVLNDKVKIGDSQEQILEVVV